MEEKKLMIISALAIVVAAALWGVDGVVLRPSLYHLQVPIVVFAEHLIAFAYMSVLLFIERNELKKLSRNDWLAFLAVALFGGAIGTMAITNALFLVNFHHLSVIVILQKLQPVFAILMAMILLKERPKKIFYLWAALALLGSYLVTFGFKQPDFSAANTLFVASLFSILAAFSFGSSTVFSKRAIQKVNFRVGTYLRFGLTVLVMAVIISALGIWPKISEITMSNIFTLVIIAFSTGGVAIFIYYWGLKRIKASHSTILELSFPATAILLDYILHGTVLDLGQWFGVMLLVFSIMQVAKLSTQNES